MTTAADDRASEDAFEALLAGRPAPEEAAGLAAFTGAVRGAAAFPARPSAALADLLSTGLLTDQSSPSARTAPTAGTERSRGRTRRRLPVIVTALVAKVLSAGAVAQAAAGAGVVVVITAGAGTAGVLPGDAQTAFSDLTGFSRAAEEQTEDELPPADGEVDQSVDGGGSVDATDPSLPAEGIEEDADQVVVEEPAEGDLTEQQWAEGPADGQPFGEWVSYGATRGWNRDGIVAQRAHERNADRKAARDAGTKAPELETPETVETPEDLERPEDVEAPEAGEHETEVQRSGDDRSKAKGGNGGGKGKSRG